ncbi:MAG: hypothetical protein JWO92_1423 [Chitinophagaceae bacterium]|nr:hypothetical protein [Chitinophagaceae bacterium]MDB5223132.1 hypothetical protein [Chitinophagaceae bacterium]
MQSPKICQTRFLQKIKKFVEINDIHAEKNPNAI